MNEIALTDTKTMSAIQAFSETMATAECVIPKHFKGKPGDCMAVIMQAMRWGMDPYIVAGKTHVVSGNLGYEAQLVNAVVSSSKAIEGRFHYEYSEDEWQSDKDPNAWIRVGATLRGESEIQWGEKLYPSKVTVKNSPLWKTNPKQQCGYLAVKMWTRLYTPAVLLGVYTPDELEEKREIDITPMAEKKSSIEKPVDVDIDTGEILDATDTSKPDLSKKSADDIKKIIDMCEDESSLMNIRIAIGEAGLSLEETATVRPHFDAVLKEMRAHFAEDSGLDDFEEQ